MARMDTGTSEYLGRVSDTAITLQLRARREDMLSAVDYDIRHGRTWSGYTEQKAETYDRIYAEAERRGLR
jgi:hypothetical protein